MFLKLNTKILIFEKILLTRSIRCGVNVVDICEREANVFTAQFLIVHSILTLLHRFSVFHIPICPISIAKPHFRKPVNAFRLSWDELTITF